MKKKVLFTSIMTIMLCLCLIGGSTYALFTSTSINTVTVKAAKVKLDATVQSLKLYSVQKAPADAAESDKVTDKKGNAYVYVEQSNNTFANTGTATFDETTATLTIERITPGDKVTFDVVGTNESDIAIKYRYVIKCTEGIEGSQSTVNADAEKLMRGLVVTIGEDSYTGLDSYTSKWFELKKGEEMADVALEIELPVTAGNEYQTAEATITITVEAVQGNAVVEDNTTPVVETLPAETTTGA